MKTYKVFCFLFLLVFQVGAQVTITPVVTDIVVSTTNIPSTYLQKNTQLIAGQDELLYFWQDYRYDEPEYMAQRVALNGTKKGNNIRMGKYTNFCYAPNGSILAIGARREEFLLTYIGKIIKEDNSSLPEFNILAGNTPWCGTLWLGLHETITVTDSHFIYFHSFGGLVSLHKFDFNGNLVYEGKGSSAGLPIFAHDVFAASNNLNEYVLFYPNNRNLFATFFSPNNTITAADVMIDTISFRFTDSDYKTLRAIPINDSVYHVLYVSKNRLSLNSWLVNKNGLEIIPLPAVAIFSSGTEDGSIDISIENCNISQMVENKFTILATIAEKTGQEKKYYNTLITYNDNGTLLSRLTDTTFYSVKGKSLHLNPDNTIIIPSSSNGEANYKKLSGLSTIVSVKLNDDSVGSNKEYPKVYGINNDTVFISYRDEENTLGRKLNFNGQLISKETILENNNIYFFKDGGMITTWNEYDAVNKIYRLGYSIYNHNFVIKKKVYLTEFNHAHQSPNCIIASDTSFIISYYKNNNVFLHSFNRNGDLLKEKLITSPNQISSVQVYSESNNEFLISYYPYSQVYDFNLEPASPLFNKYFNYYLGSLLFLDIKTEGTERTGQILTLISEDTLSSPFSLFNHEELVEILLGRINDDYFALQYKYNNLIYLKIFSFSGNQIGDSMLVHTDVPGIRNSHSLLVNENKIYSVWSEARNPDKGYDVYCSIFELNFLPGSSNKPNTSLVNEFKLQQNYPNPFNPTTNIPFTTDKDGKVEIKIYNTLGEEVAKIFNGELPTGKHKVEFNAGNLPAGIYLCQLQSGSRTQTIKLMLLK